MHVRIKPILCSWKNVLLLAGIFLLAGCKVETSGSVDLRNQAGEPVSFTGATATLFPLNADFVTPGQSPEGIGAGVVAADGSSVTVSARASAIRNARLYALEFRCPAAMPDDDCEAESPLHMVLNGAQIRAGGWRATALTDAAFHHVGYAVAAGYSSAQVHTELDHGAAALLLPLASGSEANYTDLLAWSPADTTAVVRTQHLLQFSQALIEGAQSNTIKILVQQWISPLLATLPLNGNAGDIAIAGQYAYVLNSDTDGAGSLQVIDINNVAQPVLVGSLDELRVMSGIQIVGDLAYVTESLSYLSSEHGAMHIIDVSDPRNPVRLAHFQTLSPATGVLVVGNYAVVAQAVGRETTFSGLQIIDITDPSTPLVTSSLPLARLNDMVAAGDQVFAVGATGMHQIDISNPTQPFLVRSQSLFASGAIAGAGNYVYIPGHMSGEDIEYGYDDSYVIRVIDITNPTWPAVGSIRTANSSSNLTLLGDRLYASGLQQMEVVDVSNPYLLRKVGALSMSARDHWITSEGIAFVAAGTGGLNVYDTGFVDRPPLLAGQLAVPSGVSEHAAFADGFAYSVNPERGLYVFDLSSPVMPQLLQQYTWNWSVIELFVPVGQYAYSVIKDSFSEITVRDISDPRSMQYVSHVNLYGDQFDYEWRDIVIDGNRAYVSYGYTSYDEEENIDYGGFFVLDIENPASTQVLGQHQGLSKANALAVNGEYSYLEFASGVVKVVNVSDPLAPVAVATFASPGPIESLTASDDTLYIGAGADGVHLVDITEPESPVLLTTLDTPGFVSAVAVMNGYVYVADGASGVQVVAVDNPAAPKLIGNADTLGEARGVFPSDGWLYAGTSHGIEVLKPLPAPVTAP